MPTTSYSHVVASYDGQTMRIYLNGSLCNSGSSSRSLADNGGSLRLARGANTGSSGYFDGALDEAAVYAKALSAQTVADHYAARLLAETSYAYDAAGNLTTTTLPAGNGYVETRSFDRAGRLTTVDNAKGGTSLSKFLWTLDAAGNPSKVQTTRAGADSYDVYEYDARNRLTGSCFGVGAGATSCSGAANAISYSYDKVSNRTQEVRSGNVGNTGTIDSTYNTADQLTQTTKGGQTTTFTYDGDGNQASAGSRTFTYNLADELVSTTASSTTTTYAYDGDGRRVASSVGGGAYLRSLWDPLAESGLPELALERDPSGNLVRRYLNGPRGAVSMTNASATFYYHHDPLASVTDVTDSSGVVDPEFQDKVLIADCPYGTVTMEFDHQGQLKSIDVS